MSLVDRLADKQRSVRAHLGSAAYTPLEKTFFVLEGSLALLGLSPKVALDINHVLELTTPPKLLRGLRDLVIRLATLADVEKLTTIDDISAQRVSERLERGDRCYVGESAGELLCMVWLHQGPDSFREDESTLGRWTLGADTVWSYHAMAAPAARQSGVFVKVFQRALIDSLAEPGVARILCRIKHTNLASLAVHERMGFRRVGRLISIRTPIGRWLRWQGDGSRTLMSRFDAVDLDFLI